MTLADPPIDPRNPSVGAFDDPPHDLHEPPGTILRSEPFEDGLRAPVFIGQALDDEVVAPAVTQDWTARRCAARAATTWRTYPGVTHTDVVGPGGADALTWTIARFDQTAPPPNTCPEG